MKSYDIVIIGGGLVGASLASALQHTNYRVALVDAKMPDNQDPRLFALNAGSCDFLHHIHVWDQLKEHAAAIQQVHVSVKGRFGVTRLNAEDAGLASLGYVVPAFHIETVLNEQLANTDKLDVWRPATLKAMRDHGGDVELDIETEEGVLTLNAAMVVGADGAASTVRELANIHVNTFDYQQSALVTRTTLNRSHKHIAYERFNEQGAIAMLPLSGNECATIWSGDTPFIEKLTLLDDEAFLQALQSAFGYRLGRLNKTGKRHHYPLRMMQAASMAKGNILLLGNAAHTMHPIAAQGFNLAMYEAATLMEVLLQKQQEGKRFSSADLEQVYVQVKSQQKKTMTFSHQLAQRYSGVQLVMDRLLPFGLLGLDMLAPVKQQFLKQIMGRTGRTPRLLMSAYT